jgi:16S rRNA (cytidine1402-2'-O)-methyltransferase
MSDRSNHLGKLYMVGTPIGNLQEMTFRAVEVLKSVDRIFCEDTRHSLKLLNHFEISKPLESCPYFKEEGKAQKLLEYLRSGEQVAFVSDAGMPGFSDPGWRLVRQAREAGFAVEIVGGPSSITSFIAGLPVELERFYFYGFLPPKSAARARLFASKEMILPMIFLESTHRMESTIRLWAEARPEIRLILAKELSKISEGFFMGTPEQILSAVRSWKGEWIGLAYES